MTETTDESSWIRHWLLETAAPLWLDTGARPGGGVWESLDLAGLPATGQNRRVRVQFRQAFVYADLAARFPDHPQAPRWRAFAVALNDWALTHGVDRDSGNLGALMAPDGRLLAAPHDLYDLAFVLLAGAALIRAGAGDSGHRGLAWGRQALDRLRAPVGWHEDARLGALPRRQNPHMHLFEASTALAEVTGEPFWHGVADECLGLLRNRFLAADGTVLEYFDADLNPLSEGQQVEPGHGAEWIWLLERYERLLGRSTEVDFTSMTQAMLAGRDESGLLHDRMHPPSATRRLWPQTEFLKAGLALARMGRPLPPDAAPQWVLGRLKSEYLGPAPAGGWLDLLDAKGSDVAPAPLMPASTFYHLAVAFLEADNAGKG